jgi:hypothetical protein
MNISVIRQEKNNESSFTMLSAYSLELLATSLWLTA